MPVDADAAEADLDSAQLSHEGGRRFRVVGVGEDDVIGRGPQLLAEPQPVLPLHEAAEAQRVVGGHPGAVVVEVLVHVEEEEVAARYAEPVAERRESAILADRAHRHDEDRGTAGGVVRLQRL